MKKLLSLSALQLIMIQFVCAQGVSVDFLRSTGKIYSVVVVIACIFIGIIFFMYRLDRKLTKLENQIKDEQ